MKKCGEATKSLQINKKDDWNKAEIESSYKKVWLLELSQARGHSASASQEGKEQLKDSRALPVHLQI